MGDFEWAMVNSLNSFFKREGIAAIAYRLRQSRFVTQLADILVDSKIPEYYLAIECKYGNGKPTPEQLDFGRMVRDAGGLFLVAYDVETVEKLLVEIDKVA